MKKQPLGCLSVSGLIALIVTVSFMCGSYLLFGGTLFSPGALKVSAGELSLGGVYSHAETKGQCSLCHSAPWSSESLAMRCIDCHTDVQAQFVSDENLHGYLINNNEKILCRDCHTEHQGNDALITYYGGPHYPHDLFGYSMQGHREQINGEEFSCEDCHGDDITQFSLTICSDCHLNFEPEYTDEHETMFGNDCLACHDGIDTYQNPFDHDLVDFDMSGEHAELVCTECHQMARTIADLQMTASECVDCHLEDDSHTGALGENCSACHSPLAWDQVTVDHDLTAFPLTGLHSQVACESCHVDEVFSGIPQNCVDCHSQDDIHNSVFGVDCATCHIPDSWQQVTFDHADPIAKNCTTCHLPDKPAGHYSGQCSACHSTETWQGAYFNHSVAGATNCSACHSGNIPANHYSGQCSACHTTETWQGANFNHRAAGATNCKSCHSVDKPSNHFTGQCSACHSTNTWDGATFKHTFPINHEGAKGKCSKCHPSNYSTYTCYGCHKKSKIADKHSDEGIGNYGNCIKCHWDGKEHDD